MPTIFIVFKNSNTFIQKYRHMTNFVTFQHETCDFNAIEHPINLSFAVFSALKRAVGLARDKTPSLSILDP